MSIEKEGRTEYTEISKNALDSMMNTRKEQYRTTKVVDHGIGKPYLL